MAGTKVSMWATGVITVVALAGCGQIGASVSAPDSAVRLQQVDDAQPPQGLPRVVQVAESTTPDAESPDPGTAEPTPPPEPTEPTEEPTPTPEPTPTETSEAPVPTATLTVTASPSESETAVADDSEGVPVGLWLGLGAALAAIAALIALFVLGSRRRAWEDRLQVERTQGAWVTDELVPALTDPSTPPAQVAQYWAAAQPTLNQLDVNLNHLVDDAPDEGRAMTARSIGTALTQLRSAAAGHVALIGSGTADEATLGRSAAAVTSARNQLSAAVNPVEQR